MNLVNVCLSCDDNYSKYAGVVIASILDNLSEKSFANFYILDGNITKENKDKLLQLKIQMLMKSQLIIILTYLKLLI